MIPNYTSTKGQLKQIIQANWGDFQVVGQYFGKMGGKSVNQKRSTRGKFVKSCAKFCRFVKNS